MTRSKKPDDVDRSIITWDPRAELLAPEMPASTSLNQCLRVLRRGLTVFEAVRVEELKVKPGTPPILHREMARCFRWLTRHTGGTRGLSRKDAWIVREFGYGGLIRRIDEEIIRGWWPKGYEAEVAILRAALKALERAIDHRDWGFRDRISFGVQVSLRLKYAAAQTGAEIERQAVAAKKIAMEGLDGFESRETIKASKKFTPAKRRARKGAGDAVVPAERVMKPIEIDPAAYAAFLGRPHFCAFEGGESEWDSGDFETYWLGAAPLMGRIAEALLATLGDIRELVDDNLATPVSIHDGKGSAVALVQGGPIAVEGVRRDAIVTILATDTAWPDLDPLVSLLKRTANNAGGLPILLWGPELPAVPGFIPAVEPLWPKGTLIAQAA